MMAQAGRIVMALLSIGVVSSTDLAQACVFSDGGDLHVGRYQRTVPQPRPEQRDLLSAIVNIELSEEFETVGEAIAVVLEDSGYRLSPDLSASCQEELFELPLPAVHRKLGPLTLRQALEVLSGPAYQPAMDPVRRRVSFERVPVDGPNTTQDCGCD